MATAPEIASDLSVRIQAILPRVTKLGAQHQPPVQFFKKLIDELTVALELAAAAVWMLDNPNSFGLLIERDLRRLWADSDREVALQNQRLLRGALQDPKPVTRPFEAPKAPNCNAVLLLPVIRHDECVAVVQLFGHEEQLQTESADDRLVIREILTVIDQYLERMEAAALTADPAAFLKSFQGFCRRLHQSLDPRQVAATAVNDSAHLLQSDRVSLLVRRGKHWKLQAVSGRSRVNRRSNQIRLLESLTQKAMLAGKTVLFQGSDKGLPSELQAPLAGYIEESGTRMVLISPLLVPAESFDETKSQPPTKHRPRNALVFEQFQDSRPDPHLLTHSEDVSAQVAIAIENAQSHHRIPMLGLLTMIGSCAAWFRGRRLVLSMLIAVLLGGLMGALIHLPADYRVEGHGRLMPVVQRRIFAPVQGEVVDILVNSGDKVHAGQPLILLHNDDLTDQLLSATNQLSQKEKELHALNVERHAAARTSSRDHLLRLQARQEQTQIDVDGQNERIAHLQRQIDGLILRSPIDGIMTTFRPAQDLHGRPVQRGEVLLEIYDVGGDWHLEVDVPQSRMGHVFDARKRAGDEPLQVSFKLKSHPGATFAGRLTRIVEQTSNQSETTGAVRMLIELDDKAMKSKRIGSDVSVKLSCGQRSLLYVLFGDVLEFGQRHLWF